MKRYERPLTIIYENLIALDESDFFTKQKIGAIVQYKNRIISFGYNQYKTHPIQKQFQRNEHSAFLHAEVAALYRANWLIPSDMLKKCTLYVGRIKKRLAQIEPEQSYDIITGIAKPCDGCMEAIKHFGIKKVIYSIDDAFLNHDWNKNWEIMEIK